MAITSPESATTSYNANIQQSSATQLPVHFSRKCFPGAQGFGAEPLRAMDRMQNSAPSWITGVRHLESRFATLDREALVHAHQYKS